MKVFFNELEKNIIWQKQYLYAMNSMSGCKPEGLE